MKPLLTLKDADIFPEAKQMEDFSDFTTRVAVKVSIFDQDNNIALVNTKYRLLPGGGVERNETLDEAVRREVLEEVGCAIEDIREVATTEEYRSKIKRHQITHFFTAQLSGEKGSPQTAQEDEQGIQVEWLSLDNAIILLEKELIEILFASYNSCFNVRTHLAFLKYLTTHNIA